jgi:hypothetical protein
MDDALSSLGSPAAYAAETEEDVSQLKLKALICIWDCEKNSMDKATNTFRCEWCKKRASKNATKALTHVRKASGFHISKCPFKIPENYITRYNTLFETQELKTSAKRRADNSITASLEQTQTSATEALIRKKPFRFSATTPSSVQSTLSVFSQQSIEFSNEASLEMAIADLCHAENLPFTLWQSARAK